MKNKKNKPYIMIAAGGSGGHLFSADAVSNELRKRNYRIILLTDKRVKRFLNNFKADKIILVPSDTFTNKGFIKWPQVAFKLLLGFFISLFWIILTLNTILKALLSCTNQVFLIHHFKLFWIIMKG